MSDVLSVLIVDDSDANRKQLDEFFRSMGFTTAQAENGRAAITYLSNIKNGKMPSLISSDVNMPEMDGIELLNELRASNAYKTIPFMIITSNKDDLLKMAAQCLDVNAYHLKPPDYEKIVPQLEKMFPGHNF